MSYLELTAEPPCDAEGGLALGLVPPQERCFGRYVLLSRFASGGMANLYLARAAGPGGFSKLVAIKRIHEHLSDNEAFVNMFLDEARLAARITHPNVVQVLELGRVGRSYFIAMEYVSGGSLGALLRRRTPPLAVAARIVSSAAEGLHAAHELRDSRGDALHVVHRDVSPDNVMLSGDGAVKVADFGVARARGNLNTTGTGTVKGKFAYMSPEQARSGNIDRRADLFALGIVLYEATTGTRLFQADSEMYTMAKVLRERIVPPSELVADYPARLETIVLKALDRERDHRFQSGRQMHETLEEYIAESGATVLPDTLGALVREVFAESLQQTQDFIDRSEREIGEVGAWDSEALPLDGAAEGTVLSAGETPSMTFVVGRGARIKGIVALGLLLALALLGYYWLSVPQGGANRAPVAAEESTAAAPRRARVRISVKAIPASAALLFGGERVSNPFEVSRHPEPGEKEVVAKAAGYVTRRLRVPLSQGGRFVIALDRVAPPSNVHDASTAQRAARRAIEKVRASRASVEPTRPDPQAKPKPRRIKRRPRSKARRVEQLFDSPY